MNNKEYFVMQDFIIQLEQIDYADILNILQPFIIYYVANRTIGTYRLRKDYKSKNITKVALPPELTSKYSEVDTSKLATTKFGQAITKFTETIIKNFSAEDLTNFYNNVNTLKVKSKNFFISDLFFNSNTAGQYDAKKNEISVEEDTVEISIYHELFHMASSTYKNGRVYSGFHQPPVKINDSGFGQGINEGYTELLTQRYFQTDSPVTAAYRYHVTIAKQLEKVVGQEKMKSLYLNCDLMGLIDELKQYTSTDEVMKFISNTDFLLQHIDDKKVTALEKNMINNCLKNVNRFLMISYSRKLQRQVNDGMLSTQEFLSNFTEFTSSLPANIRLRKTKYEIMTNQDVEESLRIALETPNETAFISHEEHFKTSGNKK